MPLSRVTLFLVFSLFVFTIASKAQSELLYPEILAFKGKVKSVDMYNPVLNYKSVTINYDYEKQERTIRIFFIGAQDSKRRLEREIVQSFEDMNKEVRLSYINFTGEIETIDYRYNVIKPQPHYATDRNGIKKTAGYKDANDRVTEVQFLDSNNKIVEKKVYTYPEDNNLKCMVIMTNADGKALLQQRIMKNEHGNVIKQVQQSFDADYDSHVLEFEYTYDAHGNFTRYTSKFDNGQQGLGYVRHITYMD